MKLNKEEIIYKEESSKACDYCGISSFDHIHPPNTLPKDFIRMEEKNGQQHICTCNSKLTVDEEGYIYESHSCLTCGKEERNYNIKLKSNS